MKIGIDMDGVIRDHINGLVEALVYDFPEEEVEEDPDQWTLEKVYTFVPGNFKKYLFGTRGKEVFRDSPPIPGALDGLKKLKKAKHELILITAQQGPLIPWTFHWLSENNVMVDGVLFVPGKEKHLPEYDVLIEDRSETLLKCSEVGRKVICFDHRYNRDLPNNIPRVNNWQELVFMIRRMNMEGDQ